MKRRSASVYRPVESLEDRRLMAVTPDPGSTFANAYNVGALNGAHSFSDVVSNSDVTDIYKFTMSRGGRFYGRLRAYNVPATIGLYQQSGSSVIYVTSVVANQSGPDAGYNSGNFEKYLQAGTYYCAIETNGGTTDYLARFTSDYAGNTISSARDLGTATEGIFKDFVGSFDVPSLTDKSDFYKIKMDADGKLWVDLVHETGFTGDGFRSHVNLIRDANNNGVVDAGEIIATSPSDDVGTFIKDVAKGTYYLEVVTDNFFANYRMRVNADYAPNSVGQFRDVNSSISNGLTATDWIHQPIDRWDNYTFTLSQNRAFYLNYNQQSGTAVVTLYKDTNGNNKIDSAEKVRSTIAGSSATMIENLTPGKYFVQVASPVGGGIYSLFMQAKSDTVGNTLGSAKNLGTVNGLSAAQDEFITASDTLDVYKFATSANGTANITLNSWLGIDQGVQLIKDSNNNGSVNSGEVLADSGTSSTRLDRLTKTLTKGTYFLRVYLRGSISLNGPTAGRYYLSVATDYAGNTQSTARDVGTLSGTKTFNDWASQNYGAGSDTHDYYKFRLTSTKTFSAKMIGELSGEDLDMQLYRDSNNNGKLDGSEILAVSAKKNSPKENLTKSLGAGTYFLRVYGVNGDTNYKLDLKA